jgi:hypothetical protein
VHHGCIIWPGEGQVMGVPALASPSLTVVTSFTWRGLLPECCPTTPSVRLRTREAGRRTRPELLVWGGAPRRNRTGDPILTMEPPGTAVRTALSQVAPDRRGQS